MKKNCPITSLKYLPVAVAFMALTHVAHLVVGIDSPAFEIIEVLLGFVIIITFSLRLGFCLRHRLMIYYAGAVTACIYLQRYIGLGVVRDVLRYALLWAGIILFVYVIIMEIWRRIRKNL